MSLNYKEVERNFINGELIPPKSGTELYHHLNPRTQQIMKKVVMDDSVSLKYTLKSSEDALHSWKLLAMHKKIQLLMNWYQWIIDRKDYFIHLISSENGKTEKDASAEFTRGLEVLQYAISLQPSHLGKHGSVNSSINIRSIREPLGICVGICPFNFPFMIPMWMIPISIVLGNVFILKPSEKVSGTALYLCQGAISSGVPKGVLNCVNGGPSIVNSLISYPQTKAISFVGSTKIGYIIHDLATKYRKKVQCNMGAKNHAVVTTKCNIQSAVKNIVGAAFGGCGQRCMALSVVIIVGKNQNFMDTLIDAVKEINPEKDMGALITKQSIKNINSNIESSLSHGAELLLDRRSEVPSIGNFMGPVLVRTSPNTDVYKKELFGPVLSILHCDDLQSAINLINSNPYGNGTAIFSDSLSEITQFTNNIEVGQIGINLPIPVAPPYFSWSSSKDSFIGNNYIYGPQSIDFYTKTKTIMTRGQTTDPFKNHIMSMPTN
jgi:malonate-semialdehyde dehydrogenase (acetylating) / methylmalonate-semialdehyde dehydrogenase